MEDYGYIDNLAEKLSAYFDVERDWSMGKIDCEIYARSFIKNEKYFLTKKAKVYSYENYEHCLVKYFDRLEMGVLDSFLKGLEYAREELVIPDEEHMSSIITGVIVVANRPEPELIKAIEGYKYHKSFAFGFKGWVDIRLILVHPQSGEITTNKKGKEAAKFYVAR